MIIMIEKPQQGLLGTKFYFAIQILTFCSVSISLITFAIVGLIHCQSIHLCKTILHKRCSLLYKINWSLVLLQSKTKQYVAGTQTG